MYVRHAEFYSVVGQDGVGKRDCREALVWVAGWVLFVKGDIVQSAIALQPTHLNLGTCLGP